MRILVGLALAVAVSPAGGLHAQQRDCVLDVITAPGSESRYVKVGGETRLEARGGVEATCGSSWVRADSADYFEVRGVLHLYSNVEYRDGRKTLVADRATYYRSDEWVKAEDNVVLTDSENGSTLRGPVLHYYPVTGTRSVERIFAPQRPHLTVFPDSAGAGTPYDVDADRIHLYGDSMIAGAGEVESVRGDLRAFGDSLQLDLGGGRLELLGDPRVTTENVTLVGDTILGILEDRELREIEAWPNASASGRDLSVTAPALRLFVSEGDIERLVAWRGPRAGAGGRGGGGSGLDSVAPDHWVRGETSDYVVYGDSMDVLRPGGVLSQVTTVGRARAEAAEPAVPGDSLTGTDWLVGDTIFGYFEADSASADTSALTDDNVATDGSAEAAEVDSLRQDPSRGESRLRRLVASGKARALYHVREEEEAEGDGEVTGPQRLALNYVIGKRVIIWFRTGEVERVEVVGPSTGVYLEPIPQTDRGAAGSGTADVPADTAASDSVGVPRKPPSDTTYRPSEDVRREGRGQTR